MLCIQMGKGNTFLVKHGDFSFFHTVAKFNHVHCRAVYGTFYLTSTTDIIPYVRMRSFYFLLFLCILCCPCCTQTAHWQSVGLEHNESSPIIVHSIEGVKLFADSRDGAGEAKSLLEREFETGGCDGCMLTTWSNPVKLNFPVTIKYSYSREPEKILTEEFYDLINHNDYTEDKGLDGGLIFIFYKNKWYLVWVSNRLEEPFGIATDQALDIVKGAPQRKRIN